MAKAKKQTKKPKYTFRAGSRLKGVKADAVGQELERIEAEHGELTPAAVVDESRPKDALLHGQFEWDNSKAAEEYRLQQARGLIRAVYVVLEPNQPSTPQYVHVRTEEGGVYKSVNVVVQDPDMLKIALEELQGKLESSVRSVDELRQLANAAGDRKKAKTAEVIGRHLGAARDAAKKAA